MTLIVHGCLESKFELVRIVHKRVESYTHTDICIMHLPPLAGKIVGFRLDGKFTFGKKYRKGGIGVPNTFPDRK